MTFTRIDTIMMYWTSVFFVGHLSLPVLAGLAFLISPMIPKRPTVRSSTQDDIVVSPENLSTESFKSNLVQDQKSVELDKKKV